MVERFECGGCGECFSLSVGTWVRWNYQSYGGPGLKIVCPSCYKSKRGKDN